VATRWVCRTSSNMEKKLADFSGVGLNGVDNGRLWFNNVRIPRTHLLNRFGEVTEEGKYQTHIPHRGQRFNTMLGKLQNLNSLVC
jgi:alkylation response protein AidB-like acyl-CoA dehydrogenase